MTPFDLYEKFLKILEDNSLDYKVNHISCCSRYELIIKRGDYILMDFNCHHNENVYFDDKAIIITMYPDFNCWWGQYEQTLEHQSYLLNRAVRKCFIEICRATGIEKLAKFLTKK